MSSSDGDVELGVVGAAAAAAASNAGAGAGAGSGGGAGGGSSSGGVAGTASTPPGVKAFDGNYDATPVMPGCCSGAGCFNLMCWSWCCVTIVFPIIALSIAKDTDVPEVLRWCALIAFLLWCGGVFCIPKPPPPTAPLQHTNEGKRRATTITVKKLYVVVNPHSGTKNAHNILEKCKKIWEEHGVEVVVKPTERAGHATEYARTLPTEGFHAFVVIGGDGTMFEAVNGMLRRPANERLPIGIIPGGSGNSVLRDMNVVGHTDEGEREAAMRVVRGEVAWLDANQVTLDDNLQLYSVNELTWGLTGDVGATAEGYRFLGPSRYDLCAVWGVLKGPARPVKVVVDDKRVIEGTMATAFVNQTQYFGKELRAMPYAVLDDGKMDLGVTPKAPRATLFQIFQQLPSGAHMGNDALEAIQAQHVEFYPASPGVVNIDGENFGYQSKVDVRCINKAFQLLVPASIDMSRTHGRSKVASAAQKQATPRGASAV